MMQGQKMIREAPVLIGLFAFVIVFILYAVGSLFGEQIVDAALVTRSSTDTTKLIPRSPTVAGMTPKDLVVTTYWATSALIGAVISLCLTVWSLILLRQYLVWRSFCITIAALTAAATISIVMGFDAKMTLFELPRSLTCGTAPMIATPKGFLCADLDHWVLIVFNVRFWINNIFQIAAIVILGSMLVISSVCRAACDENGFYDRLIRENLVVKMVTAMGVVLCVITLTDIFFVNWPLAATGDTFAAAAAKGSGAGGIPRPGMLAEIMTAVVAYFAVLDSATIGMTLFVARLIIGRPVPIAPITAGSPFGTILAQSKSFLLRDSTIKAVVALSPVFTILIGNPIVEQILKSVNTPAG